MAPNRITRRGATLAALLIAAILTGCGGGGSSSTATATEAASTQPSPDGAVLNTVLARQEAALQAYARVGPALPPRLARMAAYFRAQESEHVDSVLKALRGMKTPAEPTSEPLDTSGLKTDRDRLVFLYEVESATIDEELSAISSLEASWPRSLLASTVANQAQHLTLLRQALGSGPLASAPVPFENGTAPPPE
jgi:hypothetical protein